MENAFLPVNCNLAEHGSLLLAVTLPFGDAKIPTLAIFSYETAPLPLLKLEPGRPAFLSGE